METITLRTRDAEETRAFGERLGRLLAPNDVVCLSGELGAGKTVLAQGIAAGLGVEEPVSSPTFALLQEYAGRVPVYHLDAYRIASPDELIDLGFPELWQAGGVIMIEWPERLAAALPSDCLEIHLTEARETSGAEGGAAGLVPVDGAAPAPRRLTLAARGPRSKAILRALAEAR